MRIVSHIALCSAILASLVSPASTQQRSDRAQPGWIGISLDVPTVDGRVVADSDVFIGDVRRGSPAEEAGLRAGDRLLSIGDLRGAEDFHDLPDRLQLVVGERVRIRFERDGRRREIVLRAAERPADMRSRSVRLAMEPDSMVEAMMRAMDSMRVQLVRGVQERGARGTRSPSPSLRVVQEDRPSVVTAPFEFFVFRGEEHDSLRRAMDDLNRLGEDLKRQEQVRIVELRRAFSRVPESDEALRHVRTALEGVTRQSAELRAAMSEAARVTAGFEYGLPVLPRGPEVEAPEARGFRPLTPYLLGSNRVAGAQVIDLRPELAQYFDVEGGVLIVDVSPGTPAAMAGLVPGDVITRLDQVTVRSVEDLRFGVSRSGAALPLRLVRQGSTLEVLLSR